MEEYLCSIKQIFAVVGTNDPRHNTLGKLNFWLGQQLDTYAKRNPPLTRVCPIPVSDLQALDAAHQGGTDQQQTFSDLAWTTLFFLLSTRKYCRGDDDTTYQFILLQDIQFFVGQQPFNAASASAGLSTRDQADFVSLLFTTQKNGVKRESIGHSRTGNPQGFLVALCCCVTYL